MIYYISDTHFGHENVISMCNRPFSNVDEMNSIMIDRGNKKVKGNDTVYVLGDMFFRCDDPESILKQLKGRKRLLIGNHDGSWMTKVDATAYFISVDTMLETSVDNYGVTMCHYPLLTWRHKLKTYMIHGHIHNDTTSDFWPLIRNRERVLNAGVDINGFEPVTLYELIENNRRFKSEHGIKMGQRKTTLVTYRLVAGVKYIKNDEENLLMQKMKTERYVFDKERYLFLKLATSKQVTKRKKIKSNGGMINGN